MVSIDGDRAELILLDDDQVGVGSEVVLANSITGRVIENRGLGVVLEGRGMSSLSSGSITYKVTDAKPVKTEQRSGTAGSLASLFSLDNPDGDTPATDAVGAVDNPPYATGQGAGCIGLWISEVEQRLNSFQGTAGFVSNKPYRVNRFGFIFGKNASSNYAPDNWGEFGAERYAYMWNYLYTSLEEYPQWRSQDYNLAGVPGLHNFVTQCLDGKSIGSAPEAVPVPVTDSGPVPVVESTPVPAGTVATVPPVSVPTPDITRCRVTEWGEEVCEQVAGTPAINTAAADAVIDQVITARPDVTTPGQTGDDGIVIARPANPDTTWTSDDPRNDTGPLIIPRTGHREPPGIAEEFGTPQLAGQSSPVGRGRPGSEQQCEARGPGCHQRPDGKGCHCPDGGSGDSEPQTASTSTPAPDETAGSSAESVPAGEPEERFYVIRKSGTGWRKMWAGYAYRIEGYQSSFVMRIDPAITEPGYLYGYWSYPADFDLDVYGAEWRATAREKSVTACEKRAPALCPCAYEPGIWSEGPYFEYDSGPHGSYEEALDARGDIKSNAEPGSAYQWIYNDSDYDNFNNACDAIANGTANSSSDSAASLPGSAVSEPIGTAAASETNSGSGKAGYVLDRIEIPKRNYESSGTVVCTTEVSENVRRDRCLTPASPAPGNNTLDVLISHIYTVRDADAADAIWYPGDKVIIDVVGNIAGYSYCCSIGNYISARFESGEWFEIESSTGSGDGHRIGNGDIPATGSSTLFTTEREGSATMSKVLTGVVPAEGGADSFSVSLSGTNGSSVVNYHFVKK